MKLLKPYIAFLFNFDKEKLSTDIIYFHLTSKKQKQAVAHCRLQFISEKGLLRVYKYYKIGRKTKKYLRPREATEDLRNAMYLLTEKSDSPFDMKGLIEYCKTFKIPKPKVTNVCWYCLQRNIWTDLEPNNTLTYKGKSICKLCTRRELIRELQRSTLNVTAGLAKFYEQQAKRKGSLDDVLSKITLGSETNIDDKESTLFDIIPAIKPDLSTKVYQIKAIPKKLRELLINDGIKYFLPVQKQALEAGLLEDKDLLIVAGTSSGKSPLVALTNQKYEQFRKRYKKIGLKTAIRVGMSRLETEQDKPIIDGAYQSADIIVATYEAFDFLLRDGGAKELGDIGTICIDEIQMLMAKERGFRLNGLITRLKALFPKSQFIYLSATIGNPEELAKDLSAQCLTYTARPIPLERHTLLTESEEQRYSFISELCRKEERLKSSSGYYGQCLVFTNSRRGCEKVANRLKKDGIRATHYHAGLTFSERKRIESKFEQGKFSTVVTTIALGAGVDFPASLVVFENLAMGAQWLTVAEFHQMLGRAGRLGFHDKGKVYLLIEPGRKIYRGQELTEEQVAFDLLTKPIEPVEPVLDTIEEEEEVLATIVAFGRVNISTQEKMIFKNLQGRTNKLKDDVEHLKKMGMVEIKNKIIYPTKLGKAVSLSFLSPAYALRLVQEIERQRKKGDKEDLALDLAISIQPFSSAYLSSRLQAEVERLLKSTISSSVFSGVVLDLYSGNTWGQNKPTSFILDTFSNWTKYIFTCNCLDRPFCDCGEKTFSKILVDLRTKGYNPVRIATEIRKNYNIQVYPGDVYSWLDSLVHSLEAIQRLAKVLEEQELEKKAVDIAKIIEKPKYLKS
ncbi:MAG: DUF5814 domain-containing protein [Candidatus Heimdallarchaeaceae archaeon]